VLEKNRVIRSGKSPKPECIAAAAKKLSSARFVAEVQSGVRNESGPRYDRAMEALRILSESLPEIDGEMSVIENRWYGAAVADHASAMKRDISAFNEITARMKQALVFFSGKNVDMPAAGAWRDVADDIANVYFEMMGSTNRGISNNGPAPRFVAAVIPFVTGEEPSVENVAVHLKRRRSLREQNQGR
jgi:hypothetical protein